MFLDKDPAGAHAVWVCKHVLECLQEPAFWRAENVSAICKARTHAHNSALRFRLNLNATGGWDINSTASSLLTLSQRPKKMALTEEMFLEKLNKLSNTQQGIENMSSWCCFWRNDARRIVQWWEEAFSRADKTKRLTMIYLANDVLQNR